MNPVSISQAAFQWGANCDILRPSQGIETLKITLRSLYIIGVSSLIAPIGIIYHFAMSIFKETQSFRTPSAELDYLAQRHRFAGQQDWICLSKGTFIFTAGAALTFISFISLSDAYSKNDLFEASISGMGTLFGWYVFKQSLPYIGCRNLNDIHQFMVLSPLDILANL